MDKNKSIDGLTTRSSKKSAAKSSKTKTIKTKSSKVSISHSQKPSSKSSPKTIAKPTFSEASKPTTPSPETSSKDITTTPVADPINDFLKPVQAFDFDEQSGELKAAESPSPTSETSDKPKKLKKEKKPMSKKRKIILWIISIIVLLLLGAVIWFIFWGNDIIAKITGGQGNVFDLFSLTEETYDPLKTDKNGRTNILAFGTSGYNMEGDEGNGTHDGAQLTDSIMVISLDQETGDLAMLSLPRDLKASPTCTATGKINEVYWCNGGSGDATAETEAKAAQALMDEVGNILGIDFQYFAHLNWGSLVQIVDTLGGINVTLDEGVYDYNYTKAVFDPGVEYTIDGAQALGLARARHGTTGGDFTRGASQQKILIGIKNKIFEKSLSLSDIMGLASTLGENLRTNFSLSEMKTLAHLTSNFDFNSMRQISLLEPVKLMTTGNINGISYVLPVGGANYYTNIQNHIAKMFSSDPRKYEDPTILILNGTDTPGLASTEQTTLTEDGYTTTYIDDAPAGEYTEQYTLYDLTGTKPGTKKLLEEKYGSAHEASELPAGIDTTCDFVVIIGTTNESQE